MTTRWPGRTRCTSSPTSRTTPRGSCPRTRPGSAPVRPSYMCRSVPQIALEVTSSTTSSGSSSTASATVWTATSRVSRYTTARIRSPARNDDLADHPAGFHHGVRFPQGGRVNRVQFLAQRALDGALVDHLRHPVQQLVLLHPVRGRTPLQPPVLPLPGGGAPVRPSHRIPAARPPH